MLRTDKVVSRQALVLRTAPNYPKPTDMQPESPFQPYEGEGWCDEMVELTRLNPRPQGPAAPVTGSLWIRFSPSREATIVSANQSHTHYKLDGSPTLTLPTKRFMEIYKPV